MKKEMKDTLTEEEQKMADHLARLVAENEYMHYLGIEVSELRRGYCKGRMPYAKHLANPYGTLHGGSLYSLADSIGGTAACMDGNYVITVTGSMNFLRAADHGSYVYCEAYQVRQGSHLIVYDLKITDEDGEILENGSFTFYVTDNKVEY